MMLIDTHCHIQEKDFPLPLDELLAASFSSDVKKIICASVDLISSEEAINLAKKSVQENFVENQKPAVFALVGIHPHEAKNITNDIEKLREIVAANPENLVGIGEIGLDYFYNLSPRKTQISALEAQLQIAQDFALPVSFHMRNGGDPNHDAFSDFWAILDNFREIAGVMHSFTDNEKNLQIALSKNFFIGVNGIATFNKNLAQEKMYQKIPLEKMVLETDAPFLAPIPFRGQTNQPSLIPRIVEFLADLRGENFAEIADRTSKNAEKIFQI